MPSPLQALAASTFLCVTGCATRYKPQSSAPLDSREETGADTEATDTATGSDADTDTGMGTDCVDGDQDPGGACDDGDACTTDACDAGSCTHTGLPASPLDLFDREALADPSTLDVEVLSTETVWEDLTPVSVSEIRYTSYASDACALTPIRLQAFVAAPEDAASLLPGLLIAHGLGGRGTADAAAIPAAENGLVALAYSGPGEGSSEGTGSSPDHLFDAVDSPRDSWFWEHTVGAMRGLTVLQGWEGVDPDRLAMTGSSAGGLATLIVNGVDDRLSAALPVSACGYLDLAVAATPTPAWEVGLLAAMTPPNTIGDPAWIAFEAWLDPRSYLPTAHGQTLLIDGAQDEFFPITSAVATYRDLAAASGQSRILHVQDWDHGLYFSGDEAAALVLDDTRLWLCHALGTDPACAADPPQPAAPTLTPTACTGADADAASCALVSVDPGAGYAVESAAFHWSADGLVYQQRDLGKDETTGLWEARISTADGSLRSDSDLLSFATVTYDTATGPFTLSTPAHIPDGFPLEILPNG